MIEQPEEALLDQRSKLFLPKRTVFDPALIIFTILSICSILFVYRGALWNERILAPLDIGPNLFSEFQWLDPSAKGIPSNHYTVDIFDFELPRQYLIHEAVHGGELPWWQPYIEGGRPLAAEAYVSAFDPFRMFLYAFFSFETAYNWIRPIHSFLLGFTMFLLLRHLGFSSFGTILGALSFQFSSAHALSFYPPHLQATFLWYPILWIVWSSWLKQPARKHLIFSAICCAFIFISGNQQSAAYLPFFALCFGVGYAWKSREEWKRVLWLMASSGFLGALLASPVLWPQFELYLVSYRENMPYSLKFLMVTPLNLTFVFPWLLGTFRSLDIAKIAQHNGVGFSLHPGVIGALLAVFAIWKTLRSRNMDAGFRTALVLIFGYGVVICSTPLLALFYHRSSVIGLLGLTVCLAKGADLLQASIEKRDQTFFNRAVYGLAAILIVVHLFAFILYPRVIPKVKAFVVERDKTNPTLSDAPELRLFQIENLAKEITVLNPEVLISILGMVALLLVVRKKWMLKRSAVALLLVLNIAPLLLFSQRFISNQPIEMWHSLLRGSPEQREAAQVLGPFGRLDEPETSRRDPLFPGNTAAFLKVHTLLSYAGLPLYPNGRSVDAREANYDRIRTGGKASLVPDKPYRNVRYVWAEDNPRGVTVTDQSFNSIRLEIPSGPPGKLTRTDTYYPGWKIREPSGLKLERASSGYYCVEIPSEATVVALIYRPSGFEITLALSGCTAAGLFVAGLGFAERKRSGV